MIAVIFELTAAPGRRDEMRDYTLDRREQTAEDSLIFHTSIHG